MQNDLNVPAPGRYCRLQVLAFLVLNLLGSCVHVPSVHASAEPAGTAQTELKAVAQSVSNIPLTNTALP